jgi:glycosyltransferase involved in cell wall biosynthesis
MDKRVLIIQRFYYSFREGFFDYLSDINFDFKLINATIPRGKVKVDIEAKNKSFLVHVPYFFFRELYVVFPFLFFNMIRLNPKIIVTEGGANTINNIQVFFYCFFFRRKYIVWDLGKGHADFGQALLRRIYMKIYVFLLKRALYIYGYNTQSKEYFMSLGIDDSKLVVLNNTIDTRKIKKIRSAPIPNDPVGFSEQIRKGYTFLIFVGALVGNKNIESSAELMRILGDEYYLIIVGDGSPSYKNTLELAFKGTNHCFVGYKKNEQLLPYYNLSSFSILPGLGGLSINQSMAFGVPVLCNGADGAEKDLVISDKTGYIYNDLNDASAYIKSKTPEDWKNMGHEAEILLNTEHSVESMMDKFISFLKIS